MKTLLVKNSAPLDTLSVCELVDVVLKDRGINSHEEHLGLTFENLESPYAMSPDMPKAVARVLEAIAHKERIVIAGDYDADGVCASTTLFRFLSHLGALVDISIPDRHSDGYGFHISQVERAYEMGASLIITVDVGIKSHDTISHARKKNIDVIITDHHEPSETLPNAYAVVDPKLGTGDTMICGAAVAWQFGRALFQSAREQGSEILEGHEKWFLDLVGVATLGDQVPLKNQNRIFAQYGFKVLPKTKLPGLISLMYYAKLKNLSYSDISFSVVPLLNSASRMEHGLLAVKLLTSLDPDETDILARKLVALNQARKLETSKVVEAIKKNHDVIVAKNIIVAGDKKWHLGVVGIIAGKILDTYGVPVFVWGVDEEGVVRGSCRSNSGSVIEILESVSELLESFGGHHQAAGFALDKKNLKEFVTRLESFPVTKSDDAYGELVADFIISKKMHIKKIHETRTELEPMGQGFDPIVVASCLCSVTSLKKFGSEGNHLEVHLDTGVETLRGVWFFAPEVSVETHKHIQVVGSAEFDTFRKEYVLYIRDIIKLHE